MGGVCVRGRVREVCEKERVGREDGVPIMQL